MIGSSENRISYNGNGIATEFAYNFIIIEKSDIKVLHVAADGTEQLLTKDYYVDMEKSVVLYPGYAPGAEIPEQNRPPILPVGERLVLYREVPITQESALDKHWPFNVIENGLDKLTIICQQIWDRLQRSFYVSESTSTNFDPKVPIEAGKTFRVKDDGTGFEVTEDPGKVIDGATALLEQTTEQANIALESSANAQNAANSVKKYKALWFNSVAAMKAEPSLTAGTYVNTAGYYSPNDGGGASYLIREKQDSDIDNGGSIHELSNDLVAELIIENGTVNVKQFGAKGDANFYDISSNKYYYDEAKTIEADDTQAFINALSRGAIVIFPKGKYCIKSTLNLVNGIKLDGVLGETYIYYIGDGFLFDINSYLDKKPEIDGFNFKGLSTNSFVNSNRYAWGCTFGLSNFYIEDFGDKIFQMYSNYKVSIRNGGVYNCGVIDIKYNGEEATNNNFSNLLFFENVYFGYNGNSDNTLLNFKNVRSAKFINCSFERYNKLIECDDNCDDIVFDSCWAESINVIADNNKGITFINFHPAINIGKFTNQTVDYLSGYTSRIVYRNTSSDTIADLVNPAVDSVGIASANVYNENDTYDTILRLYDINTNGVRINIPLNVVHKYEENIGSATFDVRSITRYSQSLIVKCKFIIYIVYSDYSAALFVIDGYVAGTNYIILSTKKYPFYSWGKCAQDITSFSFENGILTTNIGDTAKLCNVNCEFNVISNLNA